MTRTMFTTPLLYLRFKVQRHDWGPIRAYCLNCSREELAPILSLNADIVERLADRLRQYMNLFCPLPALRIIYIGRDADQTRLPRVFRQNERNRPYGAAYYPGRRTIVVEAGLNCPLSNTLAHELTHALLYAWSGGFPYPDAVHEGFANFMELQIVGPRTVAEPRPKEPRRRPRLPAVDFMPVAELLAFNRAQKRLSPESYQSEFDKLSKTSLWLIWFLGVLPSEGVPVLARLLHELRITNARTPAKVMRWLTQACRMTEDQLDNRFRRYCLESPPAAPEPYL